MPRYFERNHRFKIIMFVRNVSINIWWHDFDYNVFGRDDVSHSKLFMEEEDKKSESSRLFRPF